MASILLIFDPDTTGLARLACTSGLDAGHRMTLAVHGLEVLQALESDRFDLLLVAVSPLGGDGVALAELVAGHPVQAGTSMLAVAEDLTPASRQRLCEAGYRNALEAPDADELAEAMDAALAAGPLSSFEAAFPRGYILFLAPSDGDRADMAG